MFELFISLPYNHKLCSEKGQPMNSMGVRGKQEIEDRKNEESYGHRHSQNENEEYDEKNRPKFHGTITFVNER